ncbi:SDR family oxidoreductase [Bacillus sp. FJAT-45037]|uniref:SDR family oxidoreductase n=1 Tax=Bacillus sp. FJAT-45037 TaxID=2011007 RepID=UPI000C243665|nr:SDR family oxidoreductase [Bacillus sp. FJAT-45037]
MNRLKSLAIITGVSRQRGIGAAIAKAFAEQGIDLFLTYWKAYDDELNLPTEQDDLRKIKEEVSSHDVNIYQFELDLSKPSSSKDLFDKVKEVYDRPATILVNNACCSINASIKTLTPELLDRHYEINIRATTLLVAQFAKELLTNGRIINLTTGWNKGTMPDELPYVLTKSAIDTLTYTLAPTLAKQRITINAINPGPTDTGWMTNEIKEHLLQRFPQGRIGNPNDVAKLATFLASPEAEWVTGQIIHSEGGFINSDG